MADTGAHLATLASLQPPCGLTATPARLRTNNGGSASSLPKSPIAYVQHRTSSSRLPIAKGDRSN